MMMLSTHGFHKVYDVLIWFPTDLRTAGPSTVGDTTDRQETTASQTVSGTSVSSEQTGIQVVTSLRGFPSH